MQKQIQRNINKYFMNYFIMGSLVILFSITSCLNDKDDSNEIDAQIVGFIALKCGCCWGWEIEIDNDTIKSDNSEILDSFGYEFPAPISVSLKLGDKIQTCSSGTESYSNKDYYEIESIKRN